eukprot:TRINITY_DN7573_c0_g1_i1.p1 TRINITY_DN7573_c0_g1~~TRINITY_DN7573_c0_g1_i1.p1  ORF type:complete len:304 (-),score=19.98 TRINITY_DN7573_c0_g1_i1:18-929(-)
MRTKVSEYLENRPNIHQDIQVVRSHCERTRNGYKDLVDYFLRSYAMLSNHGSFMFLRLNELRSMPRQITERIFLRILPIIAGRDRAPSSATLGQIIDKMISFQLEDSDEYSLEGGHWKPTNNVDWFAQRRTEGVKRQPHEKFHPKEEFSRRDSSRFQFTLGGCLLRYVRYRNIHCILVQAERIAPPFETIAISVNESKIWEGRFLISVKPSFPNYQPTQKFYCRRLTYDEWPKLLRNRKFGSKLRVRTSSLDLIMVQPAFFTEEDEFVALPFVGINLNPDVKFETTFCPQKQMLVSEVVHDMP